LTRTFLDAGILISATTGRDDLFDRAWDVLDDPERVFLSSDFVRLEVLPKAHYFHHQDEVDFYEMFFTEVAQIVPISEALISQAHLEAQSAGLGALDPCMPLRRKSAGLKSSSPQNGRPRRYFVSWD
jgi:hypothetical protein